MLLLLFFFCSEQQLSTSHGFNSRKEVYVAHRSHDYLNIVDDHIHGQAKRCEKYFTEAKISSCLVQGTAKIMHYSFQSSNKTKEKKIIPLKVSRRSPILQQTFSRTVFLWKPSLARFCFVVWVLFSVFSMFCNASFGDCTRPQRFHRQSSDIDLEIVCVLALSNSY